MCIEACSPPALTSGSEIHLDPCPFTNSNVLVSFSRKFYLPILLPPNSICLRCSYIGTIWTHFSGSLLDTFYHFQAPQPKVRGIFFHYLPRLLSRGGRMCSGQCSHKVVTAIRFISAVSCRSHWASLPQIRQEHPTQEKGNATDHKHI